MLKLFRTFYGYLLRQKGWAAVFFVVILIEPMLDSIQPIFFKLFVDTIPSLNYQRLVWILVAYVGVRLAGSLVSMASYFVGDVLLIDSVTRVRQDAVQHIHDLDFAYHTKKVSGSLISRINRGTGGFWDFSQAIHYQILGVLISFTIMLYFFQSLDSRIFLIVVLSLGFALIVTKIFIEANIRTRRRLNDMDDKITGIIADNLVGFETVKLFAKEKVERKRLRSQLNNWIKSAWAFVMTFRLLDAGMGLVILVSVFLILLISIRLTVSGQFSVGDFVLVTGFVGAFYPKLFDLVFGIRRIAQNYTDMEKFFAIFDETVKVKDPRTPVKISEVLGKVEFNDVSFSYEGKTRNAVKNINLNISPGQSIALVGRSGAGKTTLIKLLMRFYDVDQGRILIDGVDIKKFAKSDLRSLMGVVPQEPVLFNNTIGYNIAYGKEKATKEEIIAAAKIARIHDFIDELPAKYNTKVGERGIKLSGGQKQRVAIARMILSDPDIVIFDEATSQLDSENEKLIQEAFWKSSEGKTTIIIAHRLSTALRADRIIVMENGRIVEEGAHKDLLQRKKGLYKHFWDLQVSA